MNAPSSRTPKIHLVAGLLLAPAIALGGALTAQSIGIQTKVFGKPSGAPASAVSSISICATETAPRKMTLSLKGGKKGNTAGIAIGLAKANVPLLGATLLVRPDVVLFLPFDAQGQVNLTFPIPNLPGVRVFIQGAHADPTNPSALFAMSSGLDVQIVNKQPISTAFNLKTADLLMDLSHDAYEYSVSWHPWVRPRRGKLTTNSKLAGGFQVLEKIQSPNPTSKWFKNYWPDTQVFVARNGSNDIAVIFPGTELDLKNMSDVVTNMQATQVSGFHDGFRRAYLSVHSKLEKKLKEVVDSKQRVYITGHSLGGGLAPIAAHFLAPTLKCLGVRTENIVLYAFGCPRAMNATRAAELAKMVPNHYAVVNKDDLVTHVPLAAMGYTHIPNMRVFYPSHLLRNPLFKPWVSTRGTMFPELGSQYKSEVGGLTPVVSFAHYQDEYTDRIRGVLPAPKVWLTVSSTGNMVINWSFPERAKHGFGLDFIALYKGDPHKAGPGGHVPLQFKLASASGSWTTGTPKGAGFHVGYVQGYLGTFDRKFLATSGPYTWAKPKVSLSNSNGWVRLNWSIKDPGRYDYVALYNKNPWSAGPKGYLLSQWQWATKGPGWTSWRRWGSGYYIAYIEQDSLLGQPKVVAVSGPTR